MTDRPASPHVAGRPAIDRLMGQVAQEARTIPGPAPTLRQVAMVLHALADHTALLAALEHDRSGTHWPDATSVGRWLHAVGDQAQFAAADSDDPAMPISREEFGTLVDAWHTGDDPRPLHDFCGLTRSQLHQLIVPSAAQPA